ncbi:hypothetical protein AOLI_G00326320 [Acnodon oligacanthus]
MGDLEALSVILSATYPSGSLGVPEEVNILRLFSFTSAEIPLVLQLQKSRKGVLRAGSDRSYRPRNQGSLDGAVGLVVESTGLFSTGCPRRPPERGSSELSSGVEQQKTRGGQRSTPPPPVQAGRAQRGARLLKTSSPAPAIFIAEI